MEAFKANKATWEAKEESDEHAAAGGGAEAPEQFQRGLTQQLRRFLMMMMS